MSVTAGTGQWRAYHLPGESLILWIGICIVGLAITVYRIVSRDSVAIHRKYLPDHGGRRSTEDRRRFSYTYFMPERRSGVDRRMNTDRRLN